MSTLRRQMQQDMVLRGLAVKTQKCYLQQVTGLAKFYDRSPDVIDIAQVQRYLLQLIEERKLSWSSCNQAAHAIRFFYHVTLKRPEVALDIPRPRMPKKLPQILSREEVFRLFDAEINLAHRTLLMTIYAAGLRVSEAIALQPGDIDSERMTIRVEQGKGAKDRYTLLSPNLLEQLRVYWHAFRPRVWLFPGRTAEQHVHIKSVQRMYQRAKARAGIAKRGGIHALRHAFATHQLESRMDVCTIRELMGHRDLSTTSRYLHLTRPTAATLAATHDLLRRE